VSASTAAARRGRWAFQETSAWTMGDVNLFAPGHLFDLAARIESADELPAVLARLDAGLASRGRFVAHLSLSPDVQAAIVPEREEPLPERSVSTAAVSGACLDAIARRLEGRDVLLWVGFGAREAWRETRAFAAATGARVVCTPRGKGIVSELDPAFVGVTGLGGDRSVVDELVRRPPSITMVLGTRLGEMSSFWREELVPRETFIHVDLESEAIGTAYPHAPVLGVVADIGDLLRRLTPRIRGPREIVARRVAPAPAVVPDDPGRGPRLVRPAALMRAVQRVIVEGSEAIVLTEAGSAFVWGSQALRFREPGRYRVSMGFGSMGHAATGVLGAVRGSGERAVAIVGDGALLMNNEINTAVAYGIPAVWVVLNDGGFGLVDHGMRSIGFSPANLRIPRCDFAAIARAMGADGERVELEADLEAALVRALRSDVPWVVDVWVDPSEPSPFGERGASLRAQQGDPGSRKDGPQ
jgi:acetolactate synthase-1/2/3 large subunit